MESPLPTLADLLDHLFKTRQHPDGREYTYQEVSRALNGQLEASYISKLRKGQMANPTRNALILLCRFFQVSPSYFFPELADLTEPVEHPPVNPVRVALRSTGISPEAQTYLEGLISMLQQQKSDEHDGKDSH